MLRCSGSVSAVVLVVLLLFLRCFWRVDWSVPVCLSFTLRNRLHLCVHFSFKHYNMLLHVLNIAFVIDNEVLNLNSEIFSLKFELVVD